MLIRCPTCKGLGRVPKAYPSGTVMMYSGPNGENWPHEPCQSCSGSGWVEDGTPRHRAPVAPVDETECEHDPLGQIPKKDHL